MNIMPRIVLTLALALMLVSGVASAQTAEEFYDGRQMRLLLSSDAGGGYASYAIAFAPFLSKHLPGNPNIIVDYMPGAGGIRAMNYLYANGEQDGSLIALVHSSVPFAPLYGIDGARFDSLEMQWLGSMNATSGICVAWHESGVRSWEDLFDKDYFVGGSGAGSQMETLPMMLNKLFGTNIKVISGYRGGNEVYVAMERGEVDGRCGTLVSSISSTRPDWFPDQRVYVPVQIAMERNPQFPDSVAIGELAKDDLTRNILKLVLSPMDIDRPFLAPPGVPADRVAALRTAFHGAMNDPGFIAAAASIQIEIKETSSERVTEVIAAAYAMAPEVVAAANSAMNLTGANLGR
ncbi:MAG: tripartite tricarboxylate transporter substrate-binding protein [Micropepsaceae bacterium]